MTGDIGRLDKDNYLQITGRKKELIIRGGHNIYPAKIENLSMQHASVARAVALPVPDERLGEKVCLVVMCHPGFGVEPQELLEHLNRSGLSKFDMPEYFLAVNEIPLTASGKLLKREIAAKLLNGSLKPVPVRWQPPANP
jgi:acyl-CoA synthetase